MILLQPAEVARGAASVGGRELVVVVLDDGETAGCSAEARSWCCGCVRSSFLDSGARWRMDLAAVYNEWWCLLPGGWWYGVSGDV